MSLHLLKSNILANVHTAQQVLGVNNTSDQPKKDKLTFGSIGVMAAGDFPQMPL